MVEVVDSGQELRGQHVAFTGRLASMTRAEAEELVSAHGGEFVSFPNRRTDYLVVGQEGQRGQATPVRFANLIRISNGGSRGGPKYCQANNEIGFAFKHGYSREQRR